MAKLRPDEKADTDVLLETYNELLAAHKELAELTVSMTDKLGFLSQAQRLAEMQAEKCGLNIEMQKWLISYSWNLGVKSYQTREGSERELARRFFQMSTQLLGSCEKRINEQMKAEGGYLESEELQQLKVFLDLVGPQISRIHQKVLYDIF